MSQPTKERDSVGLHPDEKTPQEPMNKHVDFVPRVNLQILPNLKKTMPDCFGRSLSILQHILPPAFMLPSGSPDPQFSPEEVTEVAKNVEKLKEHYHTEGYDLATADVDACFDNIDAFIKQGKLLKIGEELTKISNALMCFNVEEFFDLRLQSTSTSLKGKNTIVFFGGTGAGKSALVHYLCGSKFKEAGSGFLPYDVKIEALKDVIVSADVVSETSHNTPVAVTVGNAEFILLDVPGFGDTRGPERDLMQSIVTISAIQEAASVRVVIVIASDNSGGRWQILKDTSDKMKQILNLEQAPSRFSFFFTKFPKGTDIKDKAERKFQKMEPAESSDPYFVSFLSSLLVFLDENQKNPFVYETLDGDNIRLWLVDLLNGAGPHTLKKITEKEPIAGKKFTTFVNPDTRTALLQQVDVEGEIAQKAVEKKDYALLKKKLDLLFRLNCITKFQFVDAKYSQCVKTATEKMNGVVLSAMTTLQKSMNDKNELTAEEVESFCMVMKTVLSEEFLCLEKTHLKPTQEKWKEMEDFILTCAIDFLVNNNIGGSTSEKHSIAHKRLQKLKLLTQAGLKGSKDLYDQALAHYEKEFATSYNDADALLQEKNLNLEVISTALTLIQSFHENLGDFLKDSKARMEKIKVNLDKYLKEIETAVESKVGVSIDAKAEHIEEIQRALKFYESAKSCVGLKIFIDDKAIHGLRNGLCDHVVRVVEAKIEKALQGIKGSYVEGGEKAELKEINLFRTIPEVRFQTESKYSELKKKLEETLEELKKSINKCSELLYNGDYGQKIAEIFKVLHSLDTAQWVKNYLGEDFKTTEGLFTTKLSLFVNEEVENLSSAAIYLEEENYGDFGTMIETFERISKIVTISKNYIPNLKEYTKKAKEHISSVLQSSFAEINQAINTVEPSYINEQTILNFENYIKFLEACKKQKVITKEKIIDIEPAYNGLTKFLANFFRTMSEKILASIAEKDEKKFPNQIEIGTMTNFLDMMNIIQSTYPKVKSAGSVPILLNQISISLQKEYLSLCGNNGNLSICNNLSYFDKYWEGSKGDKFKELQQILTQNGAQAENAALQNICNHISSGDFRGVSADLAAISFDKVTSSMKTQFSGKIADLATDTNQLIGSITKATLNQTNAQKILLSIKNNIQSLKFAQETIQRYPKINDQEGVEKLSSKIRALEDDLKTRVEHLVQLPINSDNESIIIATKDIATFEMIENYLPESFSKTLSDKKLETTKEINFRLSTIIKSYQQQTSDTFSKFVAENPPVFHFEIMEPVKNQVPFCFFLKNLTKALKDKMNEKLGDVKKMDSQNKIRALNDLSAITQHFNADLAEFFANQMQRILETEKESMNNLKHTMESAFEQKVIGDLVNDLEGLIQNPEHTSRVNGKLEPFVWKLASDITKLLQNGISQDAAEAFFNKVSDFLVVKEKLSYAFSSIDFSFKTIRTEFQSQMEILVDFVARKEKFLESTAMESVLDIFYMFLFIVYKFQCRQGGDKQLDMLFPPTTDFNFLQKLKQVCHKILKYFSDNTLDFIKNSGTVCSLESFAHTNCGKNVLLHAFEKKNIKNGLEGFLTEFAEPLKTTFNLENCTPEMIQRMNTKENKYQIVTKILGLTIVNFEQNCVEIFTEEEFPSDPKDIIFIFKPDETVFVFEEGVQIVSAINACFKDVCNSEAIETCLNFTKKNEKLVEKLKFPQVQQINKDFVKDFFNSVFSIPTTQTFIDLLQKKKKGLIEFIQESKFINQQTKFDKTRYHFYDRVQMIRKHLEELALVNQTFQIDKTNFCETFQKVIVHKSKEVIDQTLSLLEKKKIDNLDAGDSEELSILLKNIDCLEKKGMLPPPDGKSKVTAAIKELTDRLFSELENSVKSGPDYEKMAGILLQFSLIINYSLSTSNIKKELTDALERYKQIMRHAGIKELKAYLDPIVEKTLTCISTSFEGVKNAAFNNKIQSQKVDYVIGEMTTNGNIKLDENSKEQLFSFCNHTLQEYNSCKEPEKLAGLSDEKGKKELCDDLIRRIQETIKDFKTETKTKIPKLIGNIFNLWTVKRAPSFSSEDVKVQYLPQPHAAQIATVLSLLNIGNNPFLEGNLDSFAADIQNSLAQVRTGEGKSLILAVIAIFFALLEYDVSVVCFSKSLNTRDHNDFYDLFSALGVSDRIKYATIEEQCENWINEQGDLREKVEAACGGTAITTNKNHSLWKKPKGKILLLDEVDVFFSSFYGAVYTMVAGIKNAALDALFDYIWENKSKMTKKSLCESEPFKKALRSLPEDSRFLLETNVETMLADLNEYMYPPPIVRNGVVCYKHQDSLTEKINFQFKTVWCYYYLCEKGQVTKKARDDAKKLYVTCGIYSFAEIAKKFDKIIGVTGTLDNFTPELQDIIKDFYNIKRFIFMPSVYGPSNLSWACEADLKILSNEKDYFLDIVNTITRYRRNGNPVLVVFEDEKRLKKFENCKLFSEFNFDYQVMTEGMDEASRDKATKAAVQLRAVTLLVSSLARGTDFAVTDDQIAKIRGVHVLQTFLAESPSEQKQIQGRTARQGEVGTYCMVLLASELEKFGVTKAEIIQYSNRNELYKLLDTKRNQFFRDKVVENTSLIKDSLKEHQISLMFRDQLNMGFRNLFLGCLKEWNKPSQSSTHAKSKTVFLIDGTYSMAPVLQKVKNVIKYWMKSVADVLDNSEKFKGNIFSFQIVVFRNYNCNVSKLLQASSWETQPSNLTKFLDIISPSGGMGNEAIEVGLRFINQMNEATQVILIGDSAPNTATEVTIKRRTKGEKYWGSISAFATPTTMDAELRTIIQKGVPIHTFYVSQDAQFAFEAIAKLTKGTSAALDIKSPEGAQSFSNSVCIEILRDIGRQLGGNAFNELEESYKALKPSFTS